jgi:integrase
MVEARLSRPYINANLGRIKQFFKWAVSEKLLPSSVYESLATVGGLKKGRTEAREPDPVTPVPDFVVDATLPFLPPVVADMVRFQRLTGCRPGEVCLIRSCDEDRSGEMWQDVPESHKTEHYDRQRSIYIGPKAQQILLPYLLRNAESYCFSPAESRRKQYARMRELRKSKVQPSQLNRCKRRPRRTPGEHYSKDSYNWAIRRAVKRANRHREEKDQLPHWHRNQLRLAVATEIRRQFGLEAAQVTLGHAKADVTQVYAERDFELVERVMQEVG